MSEPMTPEEFARKIDYEGSIVEALDYGLRASDLDDTDAELKALWLDVEQQWMEHFQPALDALDTALTRYSE